MVSVLLERTIRTPEKDSWTWVELKLPEHTGKYAMTIFPK